MTVLTTIPNGALNKDIRDTINALLADVAALKAGGGTVTPTPTPISITGTPPTTGTVGQPYNFTPGTANGAGTKTFALTGGTLLGGLSFSTTTGAISGTPNVAGTMSGIVVRVTDSTGSASTTATNVTIAAAPAPSEVTFDPIVQRNGQQYTFTARRTTNLTQAETRSLKLAPSTSYSPAATEAELAGLTATASFAANSATAPAVFTVPATVQPE